MRTNALRSLALASCALPLAAIAAAPVELTEKTYDAGAAIVLVHINWGRSWKCGQFQNAQLEALAFTRMSGNEAPPASVDLETPSKLAVDNRHVAYALVVPPGTYALTGFDVKVAKTTTDIAHIRGTRDDLVRDGAPAGGTFTAGAGEVVYIGHFGLDCGAEPFLWRRFIQDRPEFLRYVKDVRKEFPYLGHVPVHYRLFATTMFGGPKTIAEPVVD